MKVSVVMPCLNEEKSVGPCIKAAQIGLKSSGLAGEVIVVDNGSKDNSAKVARSAGAIVISESRRGYGQAYKTGFAASRGKYLVMGDSDGTYDFREIGKLISELKKGQDMVIGSRLLGNIRSGAMPWTHRYIGTPILSWLLARLFGVKVKDSQSGYRAFTRDAYLRLNPKSTGMEFASELLINALRKKLSISEVPIDYYPRVGQSKLSSVRDAWRHIRFMLLYSPNALFIYPSLIMLFLGIPLIITLLPGPIYFNGRVYDVHLYILGSLLTVLGFQTFSLGLYAKTYAYYQGLEGKNKFLTTFYRCFSLERGLLFGFGVALVGIIVGGLIFYDWAQSGFGALSSVRPALLSLVMIIIGTQAIFTSFFISLITLYRDE